MISCRSFRASLVSHALRVAAIAVVGTIITLSATPTAAATVAMASVRLNIATDASPASVQWTVTPADADGSDGRVSLRHVLDPGSAVTDAIAVTNSGAGEATFDVHAGDGVVGGDGAFDIAAGEPGDAGRWISIDGLDNGQLTLAAGETRVLPLTITAPADARPGDHPAGIVVGLAQEREGISLRHRIGVRVHLQITGELAPALTVSAVTTDYVPTVNPFAPGTLRIEYTLHNPGNVRLGASEEVAVSGPFGMGQLEQRSAEPAELLPGATVTRTQEVSVAPFFLLSGDVGVSPVTIGDDTFTLPEAVGTSFTAWALPWTLLVLVALLTGGLFVVLALRRRAAARTQARIDAAVAAALAEDAVAPTGSVGTASSNARSDHAQVHRARSTAPEAVTTHPRY